MYDSDDDSDVVVVRRVVDMDATPAEAPLTAREERERGEALGLTGEALEVWVRAGRGARHAHRVRLATEAIRAWAQTPALQSDGSMTADQITSCAAVALLTLDRCGVGGHDGTGRQGATTRHPALAHLGTGRKQAGDGAAWDAAIYAAVRELAPTVGAWRVRPATKGAEVGLYVRAGRLEMDPTLPIPSVASGDGPEWWRDGPEVWVTLEGSHPMWVEALCRRVVATIATAGPIDMGRPDLGTDLGVDIDGSHPALEAWGELLNLARAAVVALHERERAAIESVPAVAPVGEVTW